MVSILSLALVLSARQDPKVSLELKAVRLEQAAPELARVLGLPSLELGPSIAQDVLLLRAKDVEPNVLKEKIATVLNATWEQRSDGWRLYQTDIQKDAEKKVYETERRKYYVEMVQHARAKLAKLGVFDDQFCSKLQKDCEEVTKLYEKNPRDRRNWRKMASIQERSPQNRLAARLASRVTPEMFLTLTSERPRVIFCNHPNAMQSALPFRIDDIISAYVAEQRSWSNYVAANIPAPTSDEEAITSLGRNSMMYLGGSTKSVDFKDLEMVTVELNLQSFAIELTCYDHDGKQTIKTYYNDYQDDGTDEADEAPETPAAAIERRKKQAAKLSGDALEFAELIAPINYYLSGGRPKQISSSLLAKLTSPETIDPLSIATAEVYASAVDTPNFAIALSDTDLSSRWADFVDAKPEDYAEIGFAKDKDWTTYHSTNPVMSRRSNAERKRLGNILRFVAKNKRPLSLEEHAQLAFNLPWDSDALWTYDLLLGAMKTSEVDQSNSRAAYRIFGSLSDEQRSQAHKQPVPLRNLSEAAKLEIFRGIFCCDSGSLPLQMDEVEDYEKMSEADLEKLSKLQESLWGGVYQEPTFALPNGITDKCSISIQEESTPGLYCRMQINNGDANFYGEQFQQVDAYTLGSSNFRQTKPDRYSPYGGGATYDTSAIWLTSTRAITIKVYVGQGFYYSWNLSQTLLTDPKTYTMKTLPKDILDQIDKAYKEAEKQDKEYGDMVPPVNFRTGGTTIPPPPSR